MTERLFRNNMTSPKQLLQYVESKTVPMTLNYVLYKGFQWPAEYQIHSVCFQL